jgi:pSer/pThr/pTyr-binding forkhead associated (FHA) protein
MSKTDDTDQVGLPVPVERRARASLVVLAGCAVGRVFRLSLSEAIIGRGTDAHVLLLPASVSRRHAVIRVTASRITIEDLGSKNGTFIGVDQVTKAREIRDGDELSIGDVLLKLAVSDEPAEPSVD